MNEKVEEKKKEIQIAEKFLHPISLSTDAIIQIRPNQTELEKAQFTGYKRSQMAFSPPEKGKEDQKATCLFFGIQFKYPVGVVLSISGEGSSFGEISHGWNLD